VTRAGLAAALLAVLAACGGSGPQAHFANFSTNWEDDGGVSIGRVWERVGSAAIAPSADVVVGVAGNTDKLVGMPLGGGSKWTFAHPIDARPVVAGGVVVASGGGEAFALDAKTGSVLWRRPTGGIPLLGAGDDGTVTVVTFRKVGGAGSVLLAVTHDGQVVQQLETDRPLGAPAVLGRLAFVPWSGQYVSVLDLASGDEAARVTLREQTSRAWTQGGSLWFGEVGYVRFDEHIKDASKAKATTVTLPARELPGSPKLMPSGSKAIAPVADAEDKVHIYARPRGTDSGAAVADDRWYATYFRVAMGFGAGKGKLAWARLGASDFVGGAAGEGGVVLCDQQGKVVELDAKTGGTVLEADLGEPVKACVVNVDGLRPASAPPDVKPLAQQLSEIVTSDDPQLVIAQKLLLRELATAEDDVATKALVDLASDPRTSPDLLGDARTALANRRNGATYMEAALARRYDFLKDVLRPPPVGPIAQALGAMKETGAAPQLATHLLDTADTDDDVRQTAAALAVVAGPAQVSALRQFFGLYRASAPNDDIAAALVSVGQALVRLEDTARVAAAAKDASTVPYARERLEALVAALPPKPPAPEPPKKK
jgi:outer membrane protein assembly factor BamB